MEGKKCFYVAEVSQFAADYYLKCLVCCPLEFFGNPQDYELIGYSLTELAVMAKFDYRAMNELVWRIHRWVLVSVKGMLSSKPYINYEETCNYVFKQCCAMILSYDQSKVSFGLYLRHCIFLYVRQCTIHQAIEYKRHLLVLGKRIQDSNVGCLWDSASTDPKKRIIMKTDIDAFKERLDVLDKEIFLCYLQRMAYREISEIVGKPVSTVSYRIRCILERFDVMLNIEKPRK